MNPLTPSEIASLRVPSARGLPSLVEQAADEICALRAALALCEPIVLEQAHLARYVSRPEKQGEYDAAVRAILHATGKDP